MRPPRGALNENWTFICCSKKDLPGLALHYVCIEGSCLLFWLGWLSMMDDIKKAVTQMFCVKMALIASQSAAAVVLHIKWQAFYELLAMASAKPNPKSLFLSRASMAPYGLKKKMRPFSV